MDPGAQGRAALNMMEDAVQARQLADNLNQQLRDEMAKREGSAALLLSQKEALEMVIRQAPLSSLLNHLARAVEKNSQDGTMAAIHLLNAAGTHFALAAAPSLPAEYLQARGPTHRSAEWPLLRSRGEPPRPRSSQTWRAISAGRASPSSLCAEESGRAGRHRSFPGRVLGSFGIYYPEPRAPSRQDEQLLGVLTRTVALAIDGARAQADQARLAAIVTSSEDAIVSKDLNGVITSWNRGAEHLFGYSAEEAVGRPITMLIPQDPMDEEPEILARIMRGEVVDHHETMRRRQDGTLLDISLTVSPLHDAGGRIVGASKVARDITARKQTELALREQAVALAELHRRKDEFLAMLSHELRNPLAPVTSGLELLRLERGS